MSETYEVECPMPDCAEVLGITFTQGYTLSPEEVDPGALVVEDIPSPANAHTSTWQVECMAGHVLLLPGDTGCGCDDPDGEGCPHGDGDQYDWSDDNRTFRPHDVARLHEVMARIGGWA